VVPALHGGPDRPTSDQQQEADQRWQAGNQRQEEGPQVLLGRWAILVHPIDPVGAPLHLPHRRGERHHCRQQPERQRHLATVAHALLMGQQLAHQ
jgi:hypothetical protein